MTLGTDAPTADPRTARVRCSKTAIYAGTSSRWRSLALVVFLGAALATYDPADPVPTPLAPLSLLYQPDALVHPPNPQVHNVCGIWGALAADALLSWLGVGAYYLVVLTGRARFPAAAAAGNRHAGAANAGLDRVAVGATTIVAMAFPWLIAGTGDRPGRLSRGTGQGGRRDALRHDRRIDPQRQCGAWRFAAGDRLCAHSRGDLLPAVRPRPTDDRRSAANGRSAARQPARRRRPIWIRVCRAMRPSVKVKLHGKVQAVCRCERNRGRAARTRTRTTSHRSR